MKIRNLPAVPIRMDTYTQSLVLYAVMCAYRAQMADSYETDMTDSELSDVLCDALANAMGDVGFVKWGKSNWNWLVDRQSRARKNSPSSEADDKTEGGDNGNQSNKRKAGNRNNGMERSLFWMGQKLRRWTDNPPG